MKEKRILVTGAAGFIGSHLVDNLLANDNQVVGVDNFVTGSKTNLAHLEGNPKLTFIEHDIATPLKLDGNIDYIFNFACPASPVDFERLRMNILETGCFGMFYLLQLARDKDATFVFASTSEVYGDPKEHPQSESYNGNVNITGPRAVYDESKRYGETMMAVFREEFGLDTRTVRIFNTYGERMRPDDGRAIPTFITQALLEQDLTIFGDGTQTRSIQYVSDLVAGVMLLADSKVTVPVNIGNPTEMTVKALAQKIIDLSGSKSQLISNRDLPENDPLVRKPDITRATQLLGWTPKISPDQGLSQTIDWFRKELNKKD